MSGKLMGSVKLTQAERTARFKARKNGLLPPVRSKHEQKIADNARRRARYASSVGKSEDELRPMATRDEMAARENALYAIAEEFQPATVRQIYYQAEVSGLVDKTHGGYQKVSASLLSMRLEGRIPFEWIVDNTRSVRLQSTWSNAASFFETVKHAFSLDYWDSAEARVQIWIEKDALAGVIQPVIEKFKVPLVVARGVPSWSLLHEAAEHITEFKGPTYVYYFADHDPKGEEGWRFAEGGLRERAAGSIVHFEHVAVTQQQIETFKLPTRETKGWKTEEKRACEFGPVSCDLDALTADQLRGLVGAVIRRHMPADRLATLQAEETAIQAAMLRKFTQSRP
jgi:hypothetical protein